MLAKLHHILDHLGVFEPLDQAYLESPLRQNSCRLNRISTMGGNKGWQWQGTQRSSKVER